MRPRCSHRGERGEYAEAERMGNLLQCGHGARTVENRTLCVIFDRCSVSFNAATVLAPWRTITIVDFPTPEEGLQCGHGARTVENLEATDLPLNYRAASMRPRCSHRGELLQRGKQPPLRRGFNAATVLAPWRTSHDRLRRRRREA